MSSEIGSHDKILDLWRSVLLECLFPSASFAAWLVRPWMTFKVLLETPPPILHSKIEFGLKECLYILFSKVVLEEF